MFGTLAITKLIQILANVLQIYRSLYNVITIVYLTAVPVTVLAWRHLVVQCHYYNYSLIPVQSIKIT